MLTCAGTIRSCTEAASPSPPMGVYCALTVSADKVARVPDGKAKCPGNGAGAPGGVCQIRFVGIYRRRCSVGIKMKVMKSINSEVVVAVLAVAAAAAAAVPEVRLSRFCVHFRMIARGLARRLAWCTASAGAAMENHFHLRTGIVVPLVVVVMGGTVRANASQNLAHFETHRTLSGK